MKKRINDLSQIIIFRYNDGLIPCIWRATYNALNRPLSFERQNEDGTKTVVTADYDYMGRRVYKKVETITPDPEGGNDIRTITLHQRYLYRGYLQIATLDLTRSGLNSLWLITWDPTEPVATRPLALQKDGTWYTYGIDLPKNVTEIFSNTGGIRTAYTYTPYGEVTSRGNVTQPIQWSSEYNDTELGMVYYNYRHYNPLDGRWVSRDHEKYENINKALYVYCLNIPTQVEDQLGLYAPGWEGGQAGSAWGKQRYENSNFPQQNFDFVRYNDAVLICNDYVSSKCCINNKIIDDPYIEDARNICIDFMKLYAIKGKVPPQVTCVAKCLTDYESKLKNEETCDKRNAKRLEKHIECYATCLFLPYLLFPKGGWDVGIGRLIPSYIRSL